MDLIEIIPAIRAIFCRRETVSLRLIGENGLFTQYLKTGKVPGAKTIEDVKHYYEKQVPAGRGCRVEDVVNTILYAIDQEYETGQALPVTGGQIMLH